jgi:capsular exopolysaccharide synthesis family protein
MSRIQEILARAERDGTARRTRGEDAPPPAVLEAPGGQNASPLFPRAAPTPLAPPPAPTSFVTPDTPAAQFLLEPRTAQATLHPALIAAIDPQSSVAEQYRAVRTRLSQLEETAPVRVVLVTSPGAREGKSITASNLALTMAQEFQRNVLLVDANLRAPSLHHLFGIDGTPGLSEVLSGEVSLDEALIHVPDYRLTILTSGGHASNPTELLGSTTMRRTLDTLRARFDRVLLDLPAVMPLADVGTVAQMGDGVVMVVRAGTTQRPALEQALAAFQEDRVLGLLLNDAP